MFVFELGKGIMNGLKPRGRKAWDLFLSCLSSLRAGISFDFAEIPMLPLGRSEKNEKN
ncbi:hypothetical protein [Phascolarctobacterium faecium]|uniref:hypothetical protein n=1 Tax=Phascolarctobacterium faecium TaxID=33025 RepID=UPI003AB8E642